MKNIIQDLQETNNLKITAHFPNFRPKTSIRINRVSSASYGPTTHLNFVIVEIEMLQMNERSDIVGKMMYHIAAKFQPKGVN